MVFRCFAVYVLAKKVYNRYDKWYFKFVISPLLVSTNLKIIICTLLQLSFVKVGDTDIIFLKQFGIQITNRNDIIASVMPEHLCHHTYHASTAFVRQFSRHRLCGHSIIILILFTILGPALPPPAALSLACCTLGSSSCTMSPLAKILTIMADVTLSNTGVMDYKDYDCKRFSLAVDYFMRLWLSTWQENIKTKSSILISTKNHKKKFTSNILKNKLRY